MAGVSHGTNTGTRSKRRALESLIRLADPSFDAEKRRTPEYEFNGGKRKFFGRTEVRGPYSARSEYED